MNRKRIAMSRMVQGAVAFILGAIVTIWWVIIFHNASTSGYYQQAWKWGLPTLFAAFAVGGLCVVIMSIQALKRESSTKTSIKDVEFDYGSVVELGRDPFM